MSLYSEKFIIDQLLFKIIMNIIVYACFVDRKIMMSLCVIASNKIYVNSLIKISIVYIYIDIIVYP